MLTAIGRIRLTRTYRQTAGGGSFPADDDIGVDGYLTPAATRMAVLAGVQQSFAKAEQLLRELSGWDLDDNTIRRATHAAAGAATARRATRTDAERFEKAPGVVEVPIDAGKVPTTTGWRDVKIAVFSKREPGEPATPAEWDERDLPAPTIRTVIAAVEEAETFAARVRVEADRLNVTTAPDATVLADGGEWIWNLMTLVLPLATGVLDIYHAVEHVGDAVKAIWGPGTAASAQRLEAGRAALLEGGKSGIEAWIATTMAEVPDGVSTDPLLALAAYLANHPTHLDYKGRLSEGRSIGSGQVEGLIKQVVNLRLKRTGARWRVEHVGPLVELIALSSTPEWHTFWTAA